MRKHSLAITRSHGLGSSVGQPSGGCGCATSGYGGSGYRALVLMALRSHAQEPAPESPQDPFTRAVQLSAKPGIDSEPPVDGWDWRRYAAAETIPGYSG